DERSAGSIVAGDETRPNLESLASELSVALRAVAATRFSSRSATNAPTSLHRFLLNQTRFISPMTCGSVHGEWSRVHEPVAVRKLSSESPTLRGYYGRF